MWLQRVKKTALVMVVVLAAGTAGLTWLWHERPSLEMIDWPVGPAPAENTLHVTWLGVTTVLFDDGETQILVDGFFSRPSLADIALRRPVNNDAVTINFALHEFGMRRLAAIIPVHSHYDHAMDVGAIAKRSSASIVGSESTANIARGAGVLEDQIIVANNGETVEFGEFKVRLLPSRHGPVGWRGSVPLPGTIDEPLTLPQPITAMRLGMAYSIVIEHPQGTTLVQGSSGFIDGALDDIPVDLALLCSYGLTSLGREYAEDYWQAMVTATGANAVMPMHFDDFTRPFGEITPFPKFLDNIEKTALWFEEFRDTWDTNTKLYKPEFGRPIAVYTESSSST